MAGSSDSGEDQLEKMAKLREGLKLGERIVAPTRRPDGTLRKPIKIRAGYAPPEEVGVYKPRGALLEAMTASSRVPSGYDPVQATLEKGKSSEAIVDGDTDKEEVPTAEASVDASKSAATLTSQLNELTISKDSGVVDAPAQNTESSESGTTFQYMDKKFKLLKRRRPDDP